jgi:hypothetical protein
MSKEFDDVLQSCLDLVRSGRESIDTVVARYPEFAGELRAQLETAVWLTSFNSALEPRPGFVPASRRRLVSRIKQEQQPITPPLLTWGQRLQRFLTVQKVAPVAFVFVLMLALFVSGTVVTAAQKSLPGDDLYSIKRTLEQIALATSLDNKNDAELQIQFVGNRLNEVTSLIIEQRYEEVAETVEEYQDQVNKTIEVIEAVSDQDIYLAQDLAKQLAALLKSQRYILEELYKNAPLSFRISFSSVIAFYEVTKHQTDQFSIFVPPTPTPRPTIRPTSTATKTPRPTPTPAPTQPPFEPSPTPTNTKEPTPVPPTNTPVPTNTPKPTNTPPPTSTDTPPPTPTDTPPPTPTDTPTPMPTDTPPPTPTDTPPPAPTNTPPPAPTNTPALTPTTGTGVDPTQTPAP